MPHDPDQPIDPTRRRLLVGGAVAAGAVVTSGTLLAGPALGQSGGAPEPADVEGSPTVDGAPQTSAATTRESTATSAGTTTTAPRTLSQVPGDRPLAEFARSFGLAVVDAYDGVLDAGALTDESFLVVLRLFRRQHLEGANAWTGAGGLSPDPEPGEGLVPPIPDPSTEAQALRALFDLEETVAATMQSLVSRFEATGAAAQAAGLVSSAARRATVLAGRLGLAADDVIPVFQPT